MIKEIGIHCFAPEGYSVVFRNDLNAVVARAPRLSSLVLRAPSPCNVTLAVPIVFEDIPSITHLDCGLTVDYADIHAHIGNLSSTLLSLSIHHCDTSVLHPVHTFPHLEILRCSASALPRLSGWLILPNLKTLIISQIRLVERELRAFLPFCKIHGPNLRTLSFWPVGTIIRRRYYNPDSADMQHILECCPRLEHLVLPGALASSPALSHPKVKWIDFWTMYIHSNSSFLNSVTTPNFPAVKGIRQLVVSAPLLCGHIPTTIPPHLKLEDPFEYDYPGVFLRHGNDRVYRNDATDFMGVEYDEDDESDDDYVFEDASSNPTSSDSDESADSLGSEGVEDPEWEADHESTLALHDQLRN
ncbi:hypothetical protein MVEN_00563100 [Mycena venus]|uniref:F-box domain-containing protein n=1 Tax=Mycena venus TaxID=2733690 RepID=A0A8H7D5H9_9AGAR|nr:hypothetical protein MVEN_00563100 [Mycena venus]